MTRGSNRTVNRNGSMRSPSTANIDHGAAGQTVTGVEQSVRMWQKRALETDTTLRIGRCGVHLGRYP
jgi:hypothetical protein